ncbi:MAG: sulfotransferase [Kangiellaceae bacterium]
MFNLGESEKRLATLINKGDMISAQSICRQILLKEKHHHYSLFILGMVELKQQNYSEAASYLENAMLSAPEIIIYQANFIKCLIKLGQLNRAIQVARKIRWEKIQDLNVLCVVGQIFSTFEMHKKAEILFKKALEKDPNSAHLLFNLATTQKYLANFDEAEKNLEGVIQRYPLHGPAHYALATFTDEESAMKRIQRLLLVCDSANQHFFSRVQIYFALYLEYEKKKSYEKAFKSLDFANKLYFNRANYDLAYQRSLFRAIQKTFCLEGSSENESNQLILVLGMPRSGTTLIERVLASHSHIDTVGELNYFNSGVFTEGNELKLDECGKPNISVTKREEFREVGREYLHTIAKGGSNTMYYVDKSLTNYLYLGYILKSLPNSRVILMRRNKLDSCFSNYRQLFAQHTKKYDYSYNLEATINYQTEFDDLMNYWVQLFPDNIMTIQYEELVNDFKCQVNNVLEFCNVKFENNCLEFHKNRDSSSTASFAQVRQPVSDKFIARWKHYKSYLLQDDAFASMFQNIDDYSM